MPAARQGRFAPMGFKKNEAVAKLAELYKGREDYMEALRKLADVHRQALYLVQMSLRGVTSLSRHFRERRVFLHSADLDAISRWQDIDFMVDLNSLLNTTNDGKNNREAEERLLLDLDALLKEASTLAWEWGLRAPWGTGLIAWNLGRSYRPRSGAYRPEDAEVTMGDWQPEFIWIPAESAIVPWREIDLTRLKQLSGEEGSHLPDFIPLKFPDSNPGVILFAAEYDPQIESRKDFQRRASLELMTEMTEIEKLYVDIREDANRQSQLDDHVQWLYLRICPQLDWGRPYGWPKIVNISDKQLTTVRRAVLDLGRLLEINVASIRLPHGRIPKYRN